MKYNCTQAKQSLVKQAGFFDLGLGLGLMLVFGGTAAVVDNDRSEASSLANQESEIVEPANVESRIESSVVIVKSEQQ